MRRSFMKNAKAVSPVISTIIIVSVAIVMSIAVAYWMLGLGSAFTRFEKLEFQSAYATGDQGTFTISMKVKNTGSAALTIDQEFLNGKPKDAYSNVVVNWSSSTLEPGQSAEGTITLSGEEWSSGMSVEVTIRTAAGRDYPKTIILP